MPHEKTSGSAQIVGGTHHAVTFERERGYYGTVKARFTDVSPADGIAFQDVSASCEVIDRSGSRLGYGNLSKRWGVLPPYTVIAHIGMQPRMGRLRIGFTGVSPGPSGQGRWFNFDLELLWG